MFREQELQIAYFLTTYRVLIKKISLGALIVFLIALYLYLGFNLVNYFRERKNEEAILKELGVNLIDFKGYHKTHQPQPLESSDLSLLSSGKNKYDLVVRIKNPNLGWQIPSLNYQFTWTGGRSEVGETFLLPQEEKFLMALGFESKGKPRGITLEWKNITWQRIRDKESSQEYIKEALNFEISEIRYLSSGVLPFSRVIFEAKNATPYNFWQVRFKVICYEKKRPVAANFVDIDQFLSKEKREIEVRWLEKLPRVTQVVVEAEVNIFAPDIFMPIR